MSDLTTKFATFMAEYERAANGHDVEWVLPMIARLSVPLLAGRG
jgi:hypothetical protein